LQVLVSQEGGREGWDNEQKPVKDGLLLFLDMQGEAGVGRLDRLFHLARAQTTGADFYASGGAVDFSTNRLEVRAQDALGFVVCVADVVGRDGALAADFTLPCHLYIPFVFRLKNRRKLSNTQWPDLAR
jgi:hypothetical protein